MHSAATSLVRYLDLPHAMSPLQALVVIANPHNHDQNYGQLDVEAGWQKLKAAAEPTSRAFSKNKLSTPGDCHWRETV